MTDLVKDIDIDIDINQTELSKKPVKDSNDWNREFLLKMANKSYEKGNLKKALRLVQCSEKLLVDGVDDDITRDLKALMRTISEEIETNNGKKKEIEEGEGNETSGPINEIETQTEIEIETEFDTASKEKPLASENTDFETLAPPTKRLSSAVNKMIGSLIGLFRSRRYVVPELSTLSHGFDFIALKAFKVAENEYTLLVVPVKVCEKLAHVLLIDKSALRFANEGKNNESNNNESNGKLQVVMENIRALTFSQELIFKSIREKGELFNIISKYLGGSYEVTFIEEQKCAYFHDGLSQFKLTLLPTCMMQSKYGFTEIRIPYPYQRARNIHFVSMNALPNFLSFAERKAGALMRYRTRGDSGSAERAQLYGAFLSKVQWLSLLFIPIAITLMVLAFAFIDSHLMLFVGSEITSLVLYSITLAFLYTRYRKSLRKPVFPSTPRDSVTLELIGQSFSAKDFEQFLYEEFGKESWPSLFESVGASAPSSPPISPSENPTVSAPQDDKNKADTPTPAPSGNKKGENGGNGNKSVNNGNVGKGGNGNKSANNGNGGKGGNGNKSANNGNGSKAGNGSKSANNNGDGANIRVQEYLSKI